MDNLKEIRWKMASDLNIPYGEEDSFFKGIDTAMELQLPVLFAEYLARHFMLHDPLGWVKMNTGEWMTENEIYKHWISNIYQPEKPLKRNNLKSK